MPHRACLALHLTDDELHDRYRRSHDPAEHSHWRFLWLLTGYSAALVFGIDHSGRTAL
jgi:hypothetical protein